MIIGADVNLRRVTCCRIGYGGAIDWVTYEVSAGLPALECPRMMAVQVRAEPRITELDVVWIERPSGAHIKAVADLMRVMGGFVAALPLSTSIEEVVPSEWKKLVGLPGNCGKSEVMGWAVDELARRDVGPHHLDEHRCDALAIAVACERESARGRTETGAIA